MTIPPIDPSPGRIVIRPFDTLSPKSKLVLPDSVSTGRNTTGIVVIARRGTQSVLVYDTVSYEMDEQTYEKEVEKYYIQVGDQVVFSAMSGTEIKLPEPTPENARNQQTYIIVREQDVIARITSDEGVRDASAEPRSFST